jgi:hypothetical protein
MASYPPPNENLPIFNPLNFITGGAGLTLDEGKKFFLQFPDAQGTENMETTNIDGVLTANDQAFFNDKITLEQTGAGEDALNILVDSPGYAIRATTRTDPTTNTQITILPTATNGEVNSIVQLGDALIYSTTGNLTGGSLAITALGAVADFGVRLNATDDIVEIGGQLELMTNDGIKFSNGTIQTTAYTGDGSETLAEVLAVGNSAGTNSINMNNNNITSVSNVATNTITSFSSISNTLTTPGVFDPSTTNSLTTQLLMNTTLPQLALNYVAGGKSGFPRPSADIQLLGGKVLPNAFTSPELLISGSVFSTTNPNINNYYTSLTQGKLSFYTDIDPASAVYLPNINAEIESNTGLILNVDGDISAEDNDITNALSITFTDTTIMNSAYTGGTPGTYTNTNITIDANGKISVISSGSGGSVVAGSTIQPGQTTTTPVPSTAWNANIGIGIQNYYGANSAISVNYALNPDPGLSGIPYRVDLVRIYIGSNAFFNGGTAIQMRYRTDVGVDSFGNPGNNASFRMTGELSFYPTLAGPAGTNQAFNINNTLSYTTANNQERGMSFGTYSVGFYNPGNVFATSGLGPPSENGAIYYVYPFFQYNPANEYIDVWYYMDTDYAWTLSDGTTSYTPPVFINFSLEILSNGNWSSAQGTGAYPYPTTALLQNSTRLEPLNGVITSSYTP